LHAVGGAASGERLIQQFARVFSRIPPRFRRVRHPRGNASRAEPPKRGIAMNDGLGNAALRATLFAMALTSVSAAVAQSVAATDTHVVVTDPVSRVVAPARIRPVLGDDGRTASGLATWESGGSVLYTSSDCSTGAYIYSNSNAGYRAATQVETPSGVVLVVGAYGFASTVMVRSILYDNGCTSVSVRQNGLVPVDATVNLTTTYPPPLSFR
jgi:hypothetical protein